MLISGEISVPYQARKEKKKTTVDVYRVWEKRGIVEAVCRRVLKEVFATQRKEIRYP